MSRPEEVEENLRAMLEEENVLTAKLRELCRFQTEARLVPRG